jgi:hypothetical protein
VAGEPASPEVGLSESVRLDHGAHGAVEDGDARFEQPPEGGEGVDSRGEAMGFRQVDEFQKPYKYNRFTSGSGKHHINKSVFIDMIVLAPKPTA